MAGFIGVSLIIMILAGAHVFGCVNAFDASKTTVVLLFVMSAMSTAAGVTTFMSELNRQ